MLEPEPPEKARAIFMDALVSYSDACTLPNLTPSCPYYVRTEAGPTCNDECLALIEEYGAADRPVREVKVGGLVMRGRALPISVAAGMSEFDAHQTYLQERKLPPRQQSTSSLFLGLEAHLGAFPLLETEAEVARLFDMWCELERREVPIADVAKEAILPSVAGVIGLLAAVPAMRDAGVWAADASSDFLDRLEALAGEGWAQVLEDAIAEEGSSDAARARAASTARPFNSPSDTGYLPGLADETVESEFDLGTEVMGRLVADLRLPYAMAGCFTDRVHEWLCRLVTEDLRALFIWQPPPSPVFLALRPTASEPEEVARWIWDRFTKTRLEDWAGSSLLLEWRSHRNAGPAALPPRVWQERKTDSDRVASLALEKSSDRARWRRRPDRGLQPDEFVMSAVRHLQEGRIEEAANIFAGLAELRPADGEVLNNLGFCLMPVEPQHALEVLQQASLYPRTHVVLSTANRVLALHLLGRDSAAIGLAEETLTAQHEHEHEGSCYVWAHRHDGQELELSMADDPREYLTELLAHLREVD